MSSDWISKNMTTIQPMVSVGLGGRIIIDVDVPNVHGKRDKAESHALANRIFFAMKSLRFNDVNVVDLVKAIEFYQDDTNTAGIRLQIWSRSVVPYVRRFLFAVLGEPDQHTGNRLRYSKGKVIELHWELSEDTPVDSLVTFFVGSNSSQAEELLKQEGVVEAQEPLDINEYLKLDTTETEVDNRVVVLKEIHY